MEKAATSPGLATGQTYRKACQESGMERTEKATPDVTFWISHVGLVSLAEKVRNHL